jgi:hypothetical protein
VIFKLEFINKTCLLKIKIIGEANQKDNDIEEEFRLQTLFTELQSKFNINPIKHIIENTSINLPFKKNLEHDIEKLIIQHLNKLETSKKEEIIQSINKVTINNEKHNLIKIKEDVNYFINESCDVESLIKQGQYIKYDVIRKEDDCYVNLSDLNHQLNIEDRKKFLNESSKHTGEFTWPMRKTFQGLNLLEILSSKDILLKPSSLSSSSSSSSNVSNNKHQPLWFYMSTIENDYVNESFYFLSSIDPNEYVDDVLKIIQILNNYQCGLFHANLLTGLNTLPTRKYAVFKDPKIEVDHYPFIKFNDELLKIHHPEYIHNTENNFSILIGEIYNRNEFFRLEPIQKNGVKNKHPPNVYVKIINSEKYYIGIDNNLVYQIVNGVIMCFGTLEGDIIKSNVSYHNGKYLDSIYVFTCKNVKQLVEEVD